MGLRESSAAGPSLLVCFGANRCKTRVRKNSTPHSPAGDCLPPPHPPSWQSPRLRIDCRPGRSPKLSGLQQSGSAWPLPPLPGPGDARAARPRTACTTRLNRATATRRQKGAGETEAGGGALMLQTERPCWKKWPKCTVLVPGPTLNC